MINYYVMTETEFCLNGYRDNLQIRERLPNKHICCHYFMFKHVGLKSPTKNDKIDGKKLCISYQIGSENIPNNAEKKYCCLHRNEEQEIECIKFISKYYPNKIIKLENLLVDPTKICYDAFMPGEFIRGDIETYVCCYHFGVDKSTRSYLSKPPANNGCFCINHEAPNQMAYTRYCCLHRTPKEIKDIKNIVRIELKILKFIFKDMSNYIPNIIIEIIKEYYCRQFIYFK